MPAHRTTSSCAPLLWPQHDHQYKSPLILPVDVDVDVDAGDGTPWRWCWGTINLLVGAPCLSVPSCRVICTRLDLESPSSDMPFSQPTAASFLPVPSAFARLQRSIKARMHAFSVFETWVPNILTLKRRTSLSSPRMEKSSFTSQGAKRRSFLPLLKFSSSSSSSWSSGDSTSCPKCVDSESSVESTIPDIVVTPASSICAVLPSPVGLFRNVVLIDWF
ncbi:uncharacterized protein EDB91DRAFT_83659 [Suillus paluster]|uniref:uncharacterized protein n=1 Tax=Suillus paluster TaxID=48578 RepID=UPI001B885B91|nr:uncharacterized protein EDB91DRAFT_83659 [Suillus paluster]KAG1725705.1 hypothetical protein EDB91DRAFT_83659 [Suillus paluster]